jgi:hypothetical protein
VPGGHRPNGELPAFYFEISPKGCIGGALAARNDRRAGRGARLAMATGICTGMVMSSRFNVAVVESAHFDLYQNERYYGFT